MEIDQANREADGGISLPSHGYDQKSDPTPSFGKLPPSRITEVEARTIAELRSEKRSTYRPTVLALEEILYRQLEVLGQGFVRVMDYMGDDGAVVQAARVSYGAGTRKVREDARLIRYLLSHRHTTPFEMCEIKLHVKLPIFVARQWIRHRTANVNEYSARFSILEKEFYVPDEEFLKTRTEEERVETRLAEQPGLFGVDKEAQPKHVAPQSEINRQGRGGELSAEEAKDVLKRIKEESSRAYTNYLYLLNETPDGELRDPDRRGLTRELARMVLPTNVYTQWYWKIDLHNLLHFLSLRSDPHAQYEIRAYAEVILDQVVARWVPLTCAAFRDYVAGAFTLSAPALAVVRRMLAGESVDQAASGLSAREWRELMAALGGGD